MPCSRWRHCRAERENSREGGIELELAGLAVPGCDFEKGCGWFGRWMASHLLGLRCLLGLLLFPPSPSASPVSLEQCGSWGQAEGQVQTQNWQGVSVVCWDLLANQNMTELGVCQGDQTQLCVHKVPVRRGQRGQGQQWVVLWSCPKCPARSGDSPAAAEGHRALCAAGLSRRQKVERAMNQLIMIITVLCLS